ncbi:hypothetical protein EJP77_18505 [Paenibacillus zeisoli]|uniref:Uncharacterized protein n=1 Tax=Paenibacillus zeisoli TaxID=2496267 RepID=A0A433X1L8_9BACL|nr:hypothetical protein [Paenibacillus zeisoli]RUT28008.1 hypothetical protein EJP77_18505 [Paenibacillus zeisoli]
MTKVKALYRTICLVVLVFVLTVQPLSAAASKTIKVKITLLSVELVENNHVGNEWYTESFINGKRIEEGESVTLNLKSTGSVTLKAAVEEQDSIPDEGSSSSAVKVSSISKSITKSLNVVVEENRGRYSGNTAEWKFVYQIQKL